MLHGDQRVLSAVSLGALQLGRGRLQGDGSSAWLPSRPGLIRGAHGRRVSVPAGLLKSQMAGEGVVKNLLADVERGLPDMVVDGLKIGDKTLVGGTLQDAHGADDRNAQGQRFGAGFFFIQQKGIGVNLLGQADGVTFSTMAQAWWGSR